MTVKTYDINGDFYAVYLSVTELSENTHLGLGKFALTQRTGISDATVTTTLSIQEVKLEVEP